MKKLFWMAMGAAMLCGCYAVKPMAGADMDDLRLEGNVVFQRPAKYTFWFGSNSPRDYFEITYSRFSRNEAGMPVVEVGIRFRGGTGWTNWSDKIPDTITLSAQCNFYPTMAAQAEGPVVYSTNNERITINRGATYAYRAVCPVKEAENFQLVLGE
ncbi:MAG: hypothetical protein IKP97_03940 [Kiritimatiellae bacterium]|nr:hypothetical protein [Kiritimatiellia bacterium]